MPLERHGKGVERNPVKWADLHLQSFEKSICTYLSYHTSSCGAQKSNVETTLRRYYSVLDSVSLQFIQHREACKEIIWRKPFDTFRLSPKCYSLPHCALVLAISRLSWVFKTLNMCLIFGRSSGLAAWHWQISSATARGHSSGTFKSLQQICGAKLPSMAIGESTGWTHNFRQYVVMNIASTGIWAIEHKRERGWAKAWMQMYFSDVT